MPQPTILSVDDSPINQQIIKEILEDQYNIELAFSGEECLKLTPVVSPNLILLDVSMPGLDGYETCKKIKSTPDLQNIPVIFVSAKVSRDHKLQGYEAGGYDYITKPFNYNELVAKIKNVLESVTEKANLQNNLQESFNTAMQAMSYSSDLGNILRFFESSHSCKDFDQLSNTIFQTTSQLGLSCALRIDSLEKPTYVTDQNVIAPLEISVFEAATAKKKRFFHMGEKTIICFPHISMLVRNMPIENEERYGTLKDTIFTLVSGAEERVKSLILEMRLDDSRNKMQKNFSNTLAEFNSKHNELTEKNIKAIQSMISDINAALIALDLSDFQEANIIEIIQSYSEKSKGILHETFRLHEKIAALETTLSEEFKTLIEIRDTKIESNNDITH
ncbi:MAG: response regulator [Gammaproteobacteria bacterium]|nr:MAG: response regulator [Gammaproteobacteria bacterium]